MLIKNKMYESTRIKFYGLFDVSSVEQSTH